MSHSATNRQIYEEKFKKVEDAALRMTMMMKSPYRKHRKQALLMGEMINRVQDMVKRAQEQGGENVPAEVVV